jgi:hypothetical protein
MATDKVAQRAGNDPEGKLAPHEVDTVPYEQDVVVRRALIDGLRKQPRLADSRFTLDQQQGRLASACRGSGGHHCLQLRLSPHNSTGVHPRHE